MNVSSPGIASVASITVICALAGQFIKATPLNNRCIPAVVGLCGGILGLLGMHIMPDFPASDYMTAAAVGITSGLAATGLDQARKQLGGPCR